jgi:diguanylate cyclase (GGDEF)-like protein/PAS domain S-box-containing protein
LHHSEGLIIYDDQGVIHSMNAAADELFGYAAEQAVGQGIDELIAEASCRSTPDGERISMPEGLATGLHKDGKTFPVSVSLLDVPAAPQGMRLVLVRSHASRKADAESVATGSDYYRAQYKEIPIPTYTWRKVGADFVLVDYNDASLRYTHGAIAKAIGITARQLYQDEPDIQQCFSRCYENRTVVKWEGVYRFRKSGIPDRFVQVSFGYIPADLIIVHVVDVDDYKRAEQALRESEAMWRSITQNSPDHIMLLDTEGKILFINHTVPGLTREQAIGTSVYDHVSADQSVIMSDCFQRVMTTGRADEFEVVYEGPDGPIYFSSRVGPVMDDGQVVSFIMASRDISGHKRAEDDIKQLTENLSLLLASTGEGIFGVDSQLTCTFVNQAAAGMLGYTPEQMQGEDMHRLIHYAREDGSPYQRDDCLIARCMRENHSIFSDQEVVWHKDGNFIPVQYSVNPIIVNDAIQGAVVVFRDIAEARAMARKMDYLATHDTLTGLVNRREFELRLERALAHAQAENTEYILCYLDLDQFKVVNDTCGHIAGDELLRQLTSFLREQVPVGDTLARLGGDEFGVLLGNCNLNEARAIIDNIRRTVHDFRFVWEEKPFALGVSVGVVLINGETESVGWALSAADTACYMAKDSGRNRVQIYEADDEELNLRHGEMRYVSHIQDAFDQERFRLYFQTIVPVQAQHEPGVHFEVLIRIQEENGENLLPGAFIPAAERYNLMPAIDRWVIRNVFQWLGSHPEVMQGVALCAINLSGHSLGDEDFQGFVLDQLADFRIPAAKIAFEITETAAVANLTQATAFLRKLKQVGCRFALDDFGSGMSSFAYLKNLPVDYLKIDGNFIRDIADDPVDYAMVEAIHKTGQVMGIKTIAEFVENEKILQCLRNIGIDYAQGYAISYPQSLQAFAAE